MTSTLSGRLSRIEKMLLSKRGPDDQTGRNIASAFAWLIAYHLGDFKRGVEPPAHAYGRALGYAEPRDLLEALTQPQRLDEHIRRDADARVRLLASVGVDLHSADIHTKIEALERLASSLPEEFRSKIEGAG